MSFFIALTRAMNKFITVGHGGQGFHSSEILSFRFTDLGGVRLRSFSLERRDLVRESRQATSTEDLSVLTAKDSA